MWRESKEWPLRLSSNIPKLKMVRISINLNTIVEGIVRSPPSRHPGSRLPAFAGTGSPGSRGSSNSWIPASAGMTEKTGFGFLNDRRSLHQRREYGARKLLQIH